MHLPRRDLLKAALGGATASLALPLLAPPSRTRAADAQSAAKPAYAGPIIDAHVHVWDLTRQKLPWLDRAGPPLNRSYSLADYADATAGLPIARAVYVEVAIDPAQRDAEADLVARLCDLPPGGNDKGKPALTAAVIGGDPSADGFADYVDRHRKSAAIRGVRSALKRGAAADKQFVANLRKLGERGLAFDLQIGGPTRDDAVKLAELCPDTPMVLDHCGTTDLQWFADAGRKDDARRAARDAWETNVARLAERKNVWCKISGVAESARTQPVTTEMVKPVIDACIARFGDDRVLFGSNWPVCLKTVTLRQWHHLLMQVVGGRGAAFLRKLFHDNCAAAYRLRP